MKRIPSYEEGDIRSKNTVKINILKILLIFTLFTISCQSKNIVDVPAVEVEVTSPKLETMKIWDEYRSRLESPESAEIRSRVTGIIVEAPFSEGSLVNAQTLLYVVDEKPFQAEVNNKQATLQKEKALALRKADQQKRYEKLKAENAISPDEFDQIEAEYRETKANVEIASADLETAKLNLQWARIYSPIEGRVGKKLLTVGNLVGSNVLTTVNSVNPMYVSVYTPESKLKNYLDEKAEFPDGLPCEIKTESQKEFGISGVVNFIDNHVNQNTGTIEMRCSVPNKDGVLIAGQYADVRILAKSSAKAVLVPNMSISADQDKKYILLVNESNEVIRKNILVERVFGKNSMIQESLQSTDKIIVSGLQKVKVGQKVKYKEEIKKD